MQVKIGPVDQIGQIPSIKIYQNNKEEVYGSNMTRFREQCDPLIRWATRASPSHKRRSPCCYYVPPLSQNLSNYSRFVWIHPITLNPSGSIGISQDLTRVCPQRQKPGCSAPFKGCSWWEFAFQRFISTSISRIGHPGGEACWPLIAPGFGRIFHSTQRLGP